MAFTLAAVCALQAQTAPAPSDISVGKKDDVISLEAFEVRSDSDLGYAATSAMAGGRIDTPLKNTPAAVTIMTKELMEDLGLNNFSEAAEWAPNSVISGGVADDFSDYSVIVRGIGSSYPTRNYFRWYVSSDSYNTERLEFARGPNSILFGDGNPGGISTTWTKQALFKERSSVQMRLSSYGGYRVSGDYNHPVNDKLAFRINAVHDRQDGWRGGDKPRRDGGHIAVTYRFSSRTQIRAEYERGTQRRYVYSDNYLDQSSRWDTTTSYNGVTAPSTSGTGVARINATAANDYWAYSNSAGLQNWRGFYQSTGTNLVMIPEGRDISGFPTLPSREYNIYPPDAHIDLNYTTYTAYLEQQLTSNLIAQFAYNHQYQMREGLNRRWETRRIDVNTVMPDGSPNPNYGKAFSDNRPVHDRAGNELDDWRLSLVYRDSWKWMKESLSFMSGYRKDHFSRRQWLPGRTNNPADANPLSAANIMVIREYWDLPAIPGLIDAFTADGIDIAWVNNSYSEERQSIQYNQLASMSSFFDDLLTVILGYRYDSYNRKQQRNIGQNADGTPIIGATDGPGTTDVSKFEARTKTAGLVFFPVPWLGVFGNYSQSFTAAGNGAAKIDGTLLPLALNNGIDAGFKMEFFDGKLSGSLSYYDTKQTDRARTGDNRTEINDIWDAMGATEREIPAFRDTDTYRAHGYELDLTANLTKSWRLMLNYALPKTEQINIGAGLRGYYADHIDAWRAAANDPSLPDAATIAARIATIERTIQGYEEGRAINRTEDYNANIYTTYTFHDGFLKGIGVGGGANFHGKSIIGNTPASAFDYLYSSAYEVYTAHASYSCRIGKVRARFQLNVSNLFDYDGLRYLTYARTGGIDYPNTFTYIPPRRFTFTTTLTF